MDILVTGGAGYIGSHTCVELLNNNYNVIILDNFSNSKLEVINKIETITNKKVKLYEGDVLDKDFLNKIFLENNITCVIDFAAFKAVGESVSKPIEYYINNVTSVLTLLSVMKEYNCKSLVFSSSATVYGDPKIIPITEESKTGETTNPYGTSKLFVEQILKDLFKSDNKWNICILRYFNPIGAHCSGLIGEEPNGIPANLVPFISKVASKNLEVLSVFGDDYDTLDGTGVRDYIHVVDLAIGHIKALEKLIKEKQGLYIYNLGTGIGYSVLELITTFEKVNGIKIPYKIVERRNGDIASCYSDTTKAYNELGFKAILTLEDMLKDAWNYELNNM
ncbi:MAG: UDP-glucose 4-epimerase GalE [Bacilli bacterium]